MVERRHDFVVIGVDEKERWRVGGSRDVVRCARIDGSGKVGPAVCIVVKRHGCGDLAAGRETKDPDALARDAPLPGVRADEAYRLLAVGDRERDDGRPPFWRDHSRRCRRYLHTRGIPIRRTRS